MEVVSNAPRGLTYFHRQSMGVWLAESLHVSNFQVVINKNQLMVGKPPGPQTTNKPLAETKKTWKNHGKYQLRRNTLWISNHNFTSPIVSYFTLLPTVFLGETPHFVGTTSRFPSVNTHPFSPDNGPVASLQGRSVLEIPGIRKTLKKKTRVPRPETGRFLGPILLWEFWGFYLGGSST